MRCEPHDFSGLHDVFLKNKGEFARKFIEIEDFEESKCVHDLLVERVKLGDINGRIESDGTLHTLI